MVSAVTSWGLWSWVEGLEVAGGEMLVEDDKDPVRAVEVEGFDRAGEVSESGDGVSREVSVNEAEGGWGSTSRRWAVILPGNSTSWKELLCLACLWGWKFLVG